MCCFKRDKIVKRVKHFDDFRSVIHFDDDRKFIDFDHDRKVIKRFDRKKVRRFDDFKDRDDDVKKKVVSFQPFVVQDDCDDFTPQVIVVRPKRKRKKVKKKLHCIWDVDW